MLAGPPTQVQQLGGLPGSAAGRLGQVLSGLLAQGDPLGGLLGFSVLSISRLNIIVTGFFHTTCFADGISSVNAFGY